MRNFITNEWLTVFTLLGLLLIAVAKSINPLRFKDFLIVIGNSKYLKLYAKDRKLVDLFSSILFINFLIVVSVFIYFSYSNFSTPLNFELSLYLKLLAVLSVVLLIKNILEKYISTVLNIDHIITGYLFQKITFKNYSGLVILIANLFLIYTQGSSKLIIIITGLLYVLINAIGFFTSYNYYRKLINPNIFYFLLYLCALEIGPYILLYKVIREYNT